MRPASLGAEARAPGKLVLVGEYAVLEGAPCVVLGIDRGVLCRVLRGDGVETPDGDTRFVDAALEGAPRALYQFAAWNPVDLPGKPGFGGSAAAVVAACLAGGRPAEEAVGVHRRVQGGGSGVDVLASIHGGMIRVEAGAVTPLAPVLPSVIWSGASARTQPRIAAWDAWGDAAGKRAFLQASAEIADRFPGDPVGALGDAADALIEMAALAGIPYLTPALERVIALARAFGGAAKPSGAGGGDCAVALFSDTDAQSAFEAACAAEGLAPVPVRVAPGAHLIPDR